MAFAAYWFRMSVRHRWRGLFGIAILLGIIGGLSLVTLAGARRTQSAYPRFLRSTNPSTMAVDAGGLNPDSIKLLDRTAHLPQVAAAHAYVAFYVAPMNGDLPDLERSNFEALGSQDGRYFVQDRFTPTSGRLPDPTKAGEIAMNEEAAHRFGFHVGDRFDMGTFSNEQVTDPDFFSHPSAPQLRIPSTIVGIGLFVEEVVQDDTDRSPLVLLTPAYTAKAAKWQTYAWQGLVLRGGDADVDAVKTAYLAMAAEMGAGPGFPQLFRVTSIDTFHAEQAIRPVSIALATFGAVAGLAVLLLVGQAIGRHLQAEREQRAFTRALGASPRLSALAASIGPTLAVLVGVAVAVIVAIVASPTMPLGTVRRVEVNPGIDIDWTVLGLGAVVLVVLLVATTLLLAVREAPHRVQRRSLLNRRPSGSLATRAGSLPVSMTTGLRLAFERGEGPTAVPVRSVIGGSVIAVAVLAAAITFGASLTNLVQHPRLYGWDWDVALLDSAGYGNTQPSGTQAVLGSDPAVESWSGAFFGADQIDNHNLPLLGMEVGSRVTPPIRDGRMIAKADEIVLGTATIAQLHKRVGDTVSASRGRELRIVGTATLPTIGVVHGDHTSLGIGAIVETKQVPGYDRNITGTGEYGPNVLFVRYKPGADTAAATKRLGTEEVAQQVGDSGGLALVPAQRSAEIVNSDDIGSSPTLLSGAVALSALTALAVALTAAVRRRRRDLALLKALGFTRRQLSITVAWQATGTVVVGLVVGVPVGIVFGRALWGLFARQLDVLAEPTIPLVAIAIVVVGTVAVANILSAIPARFARSVPPALVLRSE
jgi:hypothetical protein